MRRLDLSVVRFLELKNYMKQKYSAQRQTIGKVARVYYENVHIHVIKIGRKKIRAQTVVARIIPEPMKYSILLIYEAKCIQIEQRRKDLYPHIIYFNYKTLEKEKRIYFAHRYQNRVSDPLELKCQEIVSFPRVDVGNRTLLFQKNSSTFNCGAICPAWGNFFFFFKKNHLLNAQNTASLCHAC